MKISISTTMFMPLEMDSAPAVTSEESSDGTMITPNSESKSTDIKPGMITDVKNLYESEPDRHGQTTWVDTFPTDLENAAENAESARYALLIRNRKCYDGRKSLQIDSVVVQSPLLKKSLGRILEDYPGITTTLDRLTFHSPFQPFVHRWSRLVNVLDNEEDQDTRSHLALFRRIMETELKDNLKARDDFILNGVITYDTCWMIFEPGTTVFTVQEGQKCAAQFNSGRYIESRCGMAYQLSCQIVDWDGENFGLGNTAINVWEFEGTMKITKLSAFPLEYHPSLEKTEEELIQRGKAFEALSGYHYKLYRGVAIGQGPWGPIKYNVDSRIIIDTYAWNRFNPNRQVSLNSLNTLQKATKKSSHVLEQDEYDGCDEDDYYSEDSNDSDDNHEEDNSAARAKYKLTSLTNEQLLICSASLKGYSLKNKKWLAFSISEYPFASKLFSLVSDRNPSEKKVVWMKSKVKFEDSTC